MFNSVPSPIRHARRPRTRLRCETLETRETPAGNIDVSQVGKILILTGDDLNNQVNVRAVSGLGGANSTLDSTVTITGLPGTTIDKAASVKTFTGVQSLRIVLGDGNDRVEAGDEFFLVGALNFDLGEGDNALDLTPTVNRLFGGKLSVKAGDGNDTIDIRGVGTDPDQQGFDGMSFKMGDGDTFTDLRGFNNFGKVQLTAGEGDDFLQLVDVKLIVPGTGDRPAAPLSMNAGPGSLDVSLGGTTRVGAVNMSAGDHLDFSSNGVSMGATSIAAGKYGTANVNIGGTSVVGGNLSVRGQSVSMHVNGDLTVKGKLGIVATSDAEFFNSTGASTSTTGAFSLAAGAHAGFHAQGSAVTIGGNWNVTGGRSSQSEFLTGQKSEIKGSASVVGGPEQDSFTSNANFQADKALSLGLSAGGNTVVMVGDGTTPTVGGKLSILTGSGWDSITLDRTVINGATSIVTGGGVDTVSILSGSTMKGATSIGLGAGDDSLNIGAAGSAGPVTFSGKLTAQLGAGNDSLVLGRTGISKDGEVVLSAGGNKIDGGSGHDSFDDEGGQFDPAKIDVKSTDDPTP